MPLPRISKNQIDAVLVSRLLPGQQAWDCEIRGFGIVAHRCSRSYKFKYRWHGRQKMVSLGRDGVETDLKSARQKAGEMRSILISGEDPANSSGMTWRKRRPRSTMSKLLSLLRGSSTSGKRLPSARPRINQNDMAGPPPPQIRGLTKAERMSVIEYLTELQEAPSNRHAQSLTAIRLMLETKLTFEELKDITWRDVQVAKNLLAAGPEGRLVPIPFWIVPDLCRLDKTNLPLVFDFRGERPHDLWNELIAAKDLGGLSLDCLWQFSGTTYN